MKREILKRTLPLFLSLTSIALIISLNSSQEAQEKKRLYVKRLYRQEIVEREIGKIDVMMRQGKEAYNQNPFWKEHGVVETKNGRICLTNSVEPTPYNALLHHISTTGDLAEIDSKTEGLFPGYELRALNPHTPITYNGEAVTCFLTAEQKRRERGERGKRGKIRDSRLTEIIQDVELLFP